MELKKAIESLDLTKTNRYYRIVINILYTMLFIFYSHQMKWKQKRDNVWINPKLKKTWKIKERKNDEMIRIVDAKLS